MAARVLLLMALTGLFAAAWNSDCSEAANSFRVSTIRSPKSKTVAGERGRKLMVSKISQAITISPEFDLSAVSLPEQIAPGTYRLVDAQGRVGWITIPAADHSALTTGEPEPFYNSQSATGRWYFIRVATAPLIAAPQIRDAILR